MRACGEGNLSVKSALSFLYFLELLEGAARFVLLWGTHRLVLRADLLLLETDLLLLNADLLILQASALCVVPGTSILILGALIAVLDAFDGFLYTLLFATALGGNGAGKNENGERTGRKKNHESAMSSSHNTSDKNADSKRPGKSCVAT